MLTLSARISKLWGPLLAGSLESPGSAAGIHVYNEQVRVNMCQGNKQLGTVKFQPPIEILEHG